jgi:NADH-quinone oxidoreductase subunit N
MAVLLFAQAGIPFTSGFMAKFRVIYATAASGSYVLAGVAMLSAVVAAVLYLRVIASMFLIDGPAVAHAATDADTDAEASSDEEAEPASEDADEDDAEPAYVRSTEVERFRPAMASIIIAAGATVLFGIFPGIGGDILRTSAEALINLK